MKPARLAGILANLGVIASITGLPGVGNVLTANLAPSAGVATSWQWQRNGVNIAGQTAQTYTQTASDPGQLITVQINGGAFSASVSIPAVPPAFATAPTITAAAPGAVTYTAATLSTAGLPAATLYHDLYDGSSLVVAGYVSGAAISPTLNVGDTVTVRPRAVQGSTTVTGSASAGVIVSAMTMDTDVTAYAAAVTTAGGTLPSAQQSVLNSAITAMKAAAPTLRAKLKELWIPLGADGDLVTSRVKFINGATSASVTATNFVSGDYTVAQGYNAGSANSTKQIVTDFQPSVNGGLTAAEWGFSCYQTKVHTAGVAMGTSANTNAFISYATGAQTKINATGISFPGGNAFLNKRLSTVQTTGGTATAYAGGYGNASVANTGAMPAGALSVFATNSSFYSNGATSGYAVHAPLTPAELRALQTMFDTVCMGIGRTVFVTDFTAIGDSYVAGPTPTGPSVPANDYVALVAAARGWAWNFQGVSGRGWARSGNSVQGQAGINAIFAGLLQIPSTHVIIPMGLNDAYYTSAVSDVSASQIALFNMIQAVGYPPQYIAVGTCYWSSIVASQTLAASIHDTTVANAAAYGFNVIDFYHGLTADPAVGGTAPSLAAATSYQDSSVLHKNDTGHTFLAQDCVNAFATFSPAW